MGSGSMLTLIPSPLLVGGETNTIDNLVVRGPKSRVV